MNLSVLTGKCRVEVNIEMYRHLTSCVGQLRVHRNLVLCGQVKQDPDTGDIYLAQDDDVVRALVDVKENTDWLADVERAMAHQARPSQRLQRLKEQIDETQVGEQVDRGERAIR